jgi:anaerobic selenocysteine-containing dehydrogenase
MRKYGAFEIARNIYEPYEQAPVAAALEGAHVDPVSGVIRSKAQLPHAANSVPMPAVPANEHGAPVGVMIDGKPHVGFPTPSCKLEFYSRTLKEWRWPEYAIPGAVRSHVHQDEMDRDRGDFVLVPTFRLPTLIHTRSGNAKWLYEISHSNPIWMNPADAARHGFVTDALVKLNTEIGYFVGKVWVTEGIRPGVLACSHHMGRWRLATDTGGDRWSTGLASLDTSARGRWRLRIEQGVSAFASDDPDSERVWWTDAGVHQNLASPVHPDPVSGAHSWHQKVRIEKAGADDQYGDVFVDTEKAHAVYRAWLGMARPAPGPGGLRRPLWFLRPYKPDPSAYLLPAP